MHCWAREQQQSLDEYKTELCADDKNSFPSEETFLYKICPDLEHLP